MSDYIYSVLFAKRAKLREKIKQYESEIEHAQNTLVYNKDRIILLQDLYNELNDYLDPQAASSLKIPRGWWLGMGINQQGIAHLQAATKPGYRGVIRRINWPDLEPRPYFYDLSKIHADIAECKRLGIKGYMLLIEGQRSFVENKVPCPSDLAHFAYPYEGTNPDGKIIKGMTFAWWHPDQIAVNRLIAVYEAVARTFNNEPIFYGMATEETAHGLASYEVKVSEYTPTNAKNAIKQMAVRITNAMPNCTLDLTMNYLPGANADMWALMQELIQERGIDRIRWCGPDVLPDNPGLNNHLYPQMRLDTGNLIEKMLWMQNSSILRGKPQEMFDFIVQNFKVKNIMVNNHPGAAADKHLYDMMNDFVAANPTWEGGD